MKKILFLLFMIVSAGTAFSQYDYLKDVYTAADMNIKGKVKKVTETHVYTNEKGKTNESEQKWKFVYQFDESGKLIKTEHINLKSNKTTESYTYEYVNDKLSKVHVEKDSTKPTTKSFHYSSSAITIKNESGDTLEIHALSNGRISEVADGPAQFHFVSRYVYEYNSIGQIVKKIYKSDLDPSLKAVLTEKSKYNKQGEVNKREIYNEEDKLEASGDYTFEYDKNKNWTKCTGVTYSPGDDDDKVYETYTRTYEFY